MALPDPPRPASARWTRAQGCALWATVAAIVLVFAIAVLLNMIRGSIGGGEIPPLHRPTDVLEGSVDLAPASRAAEFDAELTLDDGALAAMNLGDGLVHLELDVQAEPDVGPLLVGVRWTDRAQVLRPAEPLAPGEDVRWTLACEDAAECSQTIGVSIGLGSDAATTVAWRLVAEVRPPRGSEVPETAIVDLAVAEDSE